MGDGETSTLALTKIRASSLVWCGVAWIDSWGIARRVKKGSEYITLPVKTKRMRKGENGGNERRRKRKRKEEGRGRGRKKKGIRRLKESKRQATGRQGLRE
ncbi:hypothetical protein H112_07176 [Trichophyton rubrum D6]|uniref:Uncharacterized protein n=3 Tax=Trichophyton TaxID=5550 RepID=A0A080WLB5_TRIRC|nr:uncharacterized protein TERG_11860 [Trichophyton rubrum CBS 118892]EZF11644.1 hypothetical protein H100_07201 [Trichophyton rubrum MR850]EZF38529.1 hypothetical protein H102_07161 [Trichophyton rubrum CBS 100081]EZF49241.1 hypothetical protein H103_07184 [Trichophyton rubrum CBS 288.86]EZF59933.1 hypothetical protein H104_07138 [Trichophyton rubrum CBS 289.86]EZF70380.1 hypothetical protein H105_07196 [Trichophyton soudanense CBS 452.61]EZF81194.1 hypothetical protein H110_07184 [Trichophy